jgi:carbon starvation protein
MKLGSIALLALGIFAVMPTFQMPAVTPFVNGGGPIIPGKVFRFVFITIACWCDFGFHALISSGTTPKLIDKETHARAIGYGAMLCESIVRRDGVDCGQFDVSARLFPDQRAHRGLRQD